MFKVTRVADDGTDMASIEVDDFTMEVVYSGLAALLGDAAAANPPVLTSAGAPSRQALQRRQRVLSRLRD